MSAAAQRDDSKGSHELMNGEELLALQANGTEGPQKASALRQLAAERLAAHRDRRAAVRTPVRETPVQREARQQDNVVPGRPVAAAPSVRPNVRDAVAARYRQSPSYQEFLAAEAERALQKAQAEAEVAARNAAAVAEAQRRLLDEIDHWNQPPAPLFVVEKPAEPVAVAPEPEAARPVRRHRSAQDHRAAHEEPQVQPAAPLKVQMYAELPQVAAPPAPLSNDRESFHPEELQELDEEIAFRMAPAFEERTVETVPIQANIIEFPRQLVASRKARPRLAEGPLREDGTPEPQLRIFEVEPEQVSTEPTTEPAAAPEWQSMVLASTPKLDPAHSVWAAEQEAFEAAHNLASQTVHQLHVAPVARRVMAMAVDAACIGLGLVGFSALAVRLCGPSLHGIPMPLLGGVAAVALVVFTVLYQVLFFCFNEATPGMLYARIGLCTFQDRNPSRRAVRRRLWATAVAVSPLGLGMLWMALDGDRLGWHDRISRMYPRAY